MYIEIKIEGDKKGGMDCVIGIAFAATFVVIAVKMYEEKKKKP